MHWSANMTRGDRARAIEYPAEDNVGLCPNDGRRLKLRTGTASDREFLWCPLCGPLDLPDAT